MNGFKAISRGPGGGMQSVTLNCFTNTQGEVKCLKPIVSEVCSQGYPESAICVQRFDDSLNSAIRITYRISLRSSSLREPRYPLLTVVRGYQLRRVSRHRAGAFTGRHSFPSVVK